MSSLLSQPVAPEPPHDLEAPPVPSNQDVQTAPTPTLDPSEQHAPPAPPSVQAPLPTARPIPTTSAQRTAEARRAFTTSLHNAAATLESDLSSRAKNIHSNARALGTQEAELQANIGEMKKTGDAAERELRGMKARWDKELSSAWGVGDLDGLEKQVEGVERDLGILEEWLAIEEGEDEAAMAAMVDGLEGENGMPGEGGGDLVQKTTGDDQDIEDEVGGKGKAKS